MENEEFYYHPGECQFEETLRLPVTTHKEQNEDDVRYRTLGKKSQRKRKNSLQIEEKRQDISINVVYMCLTSSECYEGELGRPLCVCVFHYDYFPVASFFSVVAATTNIIVISSNTTTFKPHVPCLSLSLSLSLVVECSTRTINERTN